VRIPNLNEPLVYNLTEPGMKGNPEFLNLNAEPLTYTWKKFYKENFELQEIISIKWSHQCWLNRSRRLREIFSGTISFDPGYPSPCSM